MTVERRLTGYQRIAVTFTVFAADLKDEPVARVVSTCHASAPTPPADTA